MIGFTLGVLYLPVFAGRTAALAAGWGQAFYPAKWSAAHHVVHWIHGGSTDLSNLILLCHRHHWMVHEGRWQIVRSDDGRMLTIPPTMTFGQLARGPD